MSESKIFEIADKLISEGKQPTQTAVREEMGGGSYATIGPALKKWKHMHAENNALKAVQVPDLIAEEVRRLGAKLWGVATEAAEQNTQGEREALAGAREDLAVEERDYKAAIASLEEEAMQLKLQIDELKAANTELSDKSAQADKFKIELELQKAVTAERESGLKAQLEQALNMIEKFEVSGE